MVFCKTVHYELIFWQGTHNFFIQNFSIFVQEALVRHFIADVVLRLWYCSKTAKDEVRGSVHTAANLKWVAVLILWYCGKA